VIIWNVISVLVNFLSVSAYLYSSIKKNPLTDCNKATPIGEPRDWMPKEKDTMEINRRDLIKGSTALMAMGGLSVPSSALGDDDLPSAGARVES